MLSCIYCILYLYLYNSYMDWYTYIVSWKSIAYNIKMIPNTASVGGGNNNLFISDMTQ